MKRVQWRMNSVVGPIYLIASEKGLQSVLSKRQAVPMAKSLTSSGPEVKFLSQAVNQLEEYFSGQRKNFDLTFDVAGTPFQKRVWQALCKIPYGKTCSYKDIAHRIKNQKAVRAVGGANGKNPLWIIVPCHRVIASNGSLCGYAGGLNIKSKLLELEKETGRSR